MENISAFHIEMHETAWCQCKVIIVNLMKARNYGLANPEIPTNQTLSILHYLWFFNASSEPCDINFNS